jgi:hypothetical protein
MMAAGSSTDDRSAISGRGFSRRMAVFVFASNRAETATFRVNRDGTDGN